VDRNLEALVVSFFCSSFELLPNAKYIKRSLQLLTSWFLVVAQGKTHEALTPASNLLVSGRKPKQLVGGMSQDLLKLVATPRNWPPEWWLCLANRSWT
jgi:hypothetical protein